MKKVYALVVAILFLCFPVIVMADTIENPVVVFDLEILTGTTTQANNTASRSGLSLFTCNIDGTQVIDIGSMGLEDYQITFQVYQIDLALSNVNKVTLTSVNASGATFEMYYIPFLVNDPNIKDKSGVTRIAGPIALSGASNVPQAITLNPATSFIEVGLLTGMTQFQTFKVRAMAH